MEWVIRKSAAEIYAQFKNSNAEIEPALSLADIATRKESINKRVYAYQAAAIYILCKNLDRPGAQFLDIGTYYGYTAVIMSLAAPLAQVVTLNPVKDEFEQAKKNLAGFPSVKTIRAVSWELLETYGGPELDFVFIDGDHKNIAYDIPWWNWLRIGGIILFHDYSPAKSIRPCEVVYNCLRTIRNKLARPFDISIIDYNDVGLVGWKKRLDDRRL